MKTCMLVLNKFTHDSRVLKEAATLAEAGMDVTVWALGDSTLPIEENVRGFTVKRWSSQIAKWRFRPPGLMLIEQIYFLTRKLIYENPDIYHAHDANSLLPCYIASKIINSKLIYDSHELWTSVQSTNINAKMRLVFIKYFEKLLISKANVVITVNPSIAGMLKSKFGVSPNVIMNCHEFIISSEKDLLRKKLGISNDKKIVVFVGAFVKNRGLKQLIISAQYLDNTVMVLLGMDKLKGELQKFANKIGVQEKIIFLPPVKPDQVNNIVKGADIGVDPSQASVLNNYYGSGNKLFHYLTAGIPLAVSNHPEKRRIIIKFDVGITFDETNPKDIAEKINYLLEDKIRYKQLCKNARKAAREDLNWEVEKQKLLKIYKRFSKT